MLFNGEFFSAILTLQLDDTTTVLLGGVGKDKSIVTFSWETMTHTLQPATLLRSRLEAACGALKLRNGQVKLGLVGLQLVVSNTKNHCKCCNLSPTNHFLIGS